MSLLIGPFDTHPIELHAQPTHKTKSQKRAHFVQFIRMEGDMVSFF